VVKVPRGFLYSIFCFIFCFMGLMRLLQGCQTWCPDQLLSLSLFPNISGLLTILHWKSLQTETSDTLPDRTKL